MNFELVETVDAENPTEGDLRLTNGQLTLIDGDAAIRQHLRNRLRMFLAEWFLDQRQGFPYYQDVLVKNPDKPSVRALLRQTVLETPGIAAVESLTLTVVQRQATVSFTAILDGSGEPLVFEDFIL